MSGALWHSEVDSRAFKTATVALVAIVNLIHPLVTLLHSYATYRSTCQNRRSAGASCIAKTRSRNSRIDSTLYFLFHSVIFPVASGFLLIDLDSSKGICWGSYMIGLVMMTGSIYFTFKLFIAKARLFDAMLQWKRALTLAWIVLHFIYLPASLLIIVISSFHWTPSFLEVDEEERCVETHNGVFSYVFLSIQFVISGLCLLILTGPLNGSQVSRNFPQAVRYLNDKKSGKFPPHANTYIVFQMFFWLYIIVSPHPAYQSDDR
ncbi:hypothetical protein AAMO2058_000304400 [Amorphochlora amoebiformis]